MKYCKFHNNRKGFTLFLTFMVMLIVVFAGMFSRAEQIVEIFALQKKILKRENISIELANTAKAEELDHKNLK
ncbi:MAG: hypothetical protein ACQETH_15055 [Candidatus Rifleibacteriota bacterium]